MLGRGCFLTVVSVAALAFLAGGCSDEPGLTEKQESFKYATEVILVNSPGGAPSELFQPTAVNESNAASILFSWMEEGAFTDRGFGAIQDLRGAELRHVRLWKTEGQFPYYEVALRDAKGEELRWLVGPDGWTFLNGNARSWLRDNDFGDMCDLLIEAVEGHEDSKAELMRVTGEACNWALGRG